MTDPRATNANIGTNQPIRFLRVDVNKKPLDKQIAQTYQDYYGWGDEVVTCTGENNFVVHSVLPNGALTITFSPLNNFRGRTVSVEILEITLNDIMLSLLPDGLFVVSGTTVTPPVSTYTIPAGSRGKVELDFCDYEFVVLSVGNLFDGVGGRLASARYNVPATFFTLLAADPNPSYVPLDNVVQGLNDYDNNLTHWTFTDPTTITINTTGYYNVGIYMSALSLGVGELIFQINNLVDGAQGAVPAVVATNAGFVVPSFPLLPGYTHAATENASNNCYLLAGSTLRITYTTTIDCDVSPTSCLNITKLDANVGIVGPPGPPGPNDNIYNTNGTITDPYRQVDFAGKEMFFNGVGGNGRFNVEADEIFLESPDVRLMTTPATDNTKSNVLVRDGLTGQLFLRDSSSIDGATIYTADGTLTGDRDVTLGANYLEIKQGGLLFGLYGTVGHIQVTTNSDIFIDSPIIRLTQALTQNNTLTNVMSRNLVTGDIEQRSIESFRFLSYDYSTILNNVNHQYYVNTVIYAATLDLPNSVAGMDRLASGWTCFPHFPSRVEFQMLASPLSSLAPVGGIVTASLYYIPGTTGQRVAGTEVFVKSITVNVTATVNNVGEAFPADYPLANVGSCWSIVITNPVANNVQLNGFIRFYE